MRARSRGTVVLLAVGLVLVVALPAGAQPRARPAASSAKNPWSPIETPLPVNAAATQGAPPIHSLACPAPGVCVGVGSYSSSSGGGLIEMYSGGTWTPVQTVPPDVSLGSVSCASVDSCVAAGYYIDTSGDVQLIAETLSDGAWTAQNLPLPANAASPYNAGIAALTCPAVDSCVAVGWYYDTKSNGQPLIETLSGGSWTATEASVPVNSDAVLGIGHFLYDVDCAAAGSCVAVGNYTAHDHVEGLIESLSGGAWADEEAPLPPNASVHTALLRYLACPTGSFCVALGGYVADRQDEQLIETLSSGTWTATEAPLPANATRYPGGPTLYALACPSAHFCTAVGNYFAGRHDGLGLIDTLSGGTWTATSAPLPANAVALNGSWALDTVACSAAHSCVAGGAYNTSNAFEGLLETLSGGTWTPTEAPLPADAQVPPWAGIDDVACPSGGPCVALGHYHGGFDQVIETR
jgi:hypothetical protein